MALLLREAIGAGLRRARTARRRTLRDVSRTARVSLGYLSEVERGRKEPSSELLAAICEALDVTLPDLLTEAAHSLAGSTRCRVRAAPADRPAPHRPADRRCGHRAAGRCTHGGASRPGPSGGARRRLIPRRPPSRHRTHAYRAGPRFGPSGESSVGIVAFGPSVRPPDHDHR